jgi:hypothetical protein
MSILARWKPLSGPVLLAALVCMLGGCQATYVRVSIIDACDINPVFCNSGGESEVPGYESGSASYRQFGQSSATVKVTLRKSLVETEHAVFLCPGALSDSGGFQGCSPVGGFATDADGNGSFQEKFSDIDSLYTVIAINVAPFATVLANCPDEPNVSCDPDPLD